MAVLRAKSSTPDPGKETDLSPNLGGAACGEEIENGK